MKKKNCWEMQQCGREPGGNNSLSMGVCEAASDESADGINRGKNGGRACWGIAGTLCEGEVQGNYSEKIGDCVRCEFYRLVKEEEGDSWKGGIFVILQRKKAI
jgi:eukaryotic-like serine/threonine-protein kinase